MQLVGCQDSLDRILDGSGIGRFGTIPVQLRSSATAAPAANRVDTTIVAMIRVTLPCMLSIHSFVMALPPSGS
jgi:hypothetical protein